MENDCIAFGDDFNSFPEEIPQFSTFNFKFSISGESPTNSNLKRSTRIVFVYIKFTSKMVDKPAVCVYSILGFSLRKGRIKYV